MSFYLVLPSNSSYKYFPHNTLSNFTTRLPNEIDLSEGYEVALTEVQYTHNWHSFRQEDRVTFAYKPPDGNWRHVIVPPGYYHTKGDLITFLNATLGPETSNQVKLSWDKTHNIVTLEAGGGAIIKFSSSLKRLLDFPERLGELASGVWYSGSRGALNKDITALYVYCDIVRPRVVGDSRVSLLRPVPVTGAHGENVFFSFTNVHYLPLNINIFQTVELDIRDDTGQPVPFESGRVVCTLHFRKT
jgi:hypothetical protein